MSDFILWEEPITDRTQSDIDVVNYLKGLSWNEMTAEQKQMWTKGLKGALNEKDLNRIENNIHLLCQVFEIELITYDGNIPYIPTLSYWQNLLNNVEVIRGMHSVHTDTPVVPELPINDFSKVNDIEKILLDIYNILLTNFFYESIDDFHMGEECGLIL